MRQLNNNEIKEVSGAGSYLSDRILGGVGKIISVASLG